MPGAQFDNIEHQLSLWCGISLIEGDSNSTGCRDLELGIAGHNCGTLGRALGDAFITAVGYINLRQVQNMLFVPSFVILALDLVLVLMKRET